MSADRIKELSCEVTRDLLPLYADNVCCDESKELVEHHLAECQDCIKELLLIKDETLELKEKAPTIDTTKFTMKRAMKKTRRKWMLSILLVLAVMIGGFGLYLQVMDRHSKIHAVYAHIMNAGTKVKSERMIDAIKKQDFERAFKYIDTKGFYEEMKKDGENIKDKNGAEIEVATLELNAFTQICKEKFITNMTKMINDGYEIHSMSYQNPDRDEGINNFYILFEYGNAHNEYKERIHFEESKGKLSYLGTKSYGDDNFFMFKIFWLSIY